MARKAQNMSDNETPAVEATDTVAAPVVKKARAPRKKTPLNIVLRVTNESGDPVAANVEVLAATRNVAVLGKTLIANHTRGGLQTLEFGGEDE